MSEAQCLNNINQEDTQFQSGLRGFGFGGGFDFR